MTYPHNRLDDAGLLKVLEVARQNTALVVLHCENHDAILWMTDKLLEAGLTQPKHHAWCKPAVVEREAVSRAIALAELVDCPIQIFHVTCAAVAEEIQRAQSRGLKVWAETCTHYLTITEDDLDRPGQEGAKFVFSPAARSAQEHDALWAHIKTGTLTNITSDHAPAYFYGKREGEFGKLDAGPDARFDQIANGMPGLETRMQVLYNEGVVTGRITMNEFVALTSTNAAKLFGIHPRKGTIAPGADADIVIWDAEADSVITQDALHHHADYTPFEGMAVKGRADVVMSRGDILIDGGKPTDVALRGGRGRFLAREPYDFIRPSNKFVTPFNPHTGADLS